MRVSLQSVAADAAAGGKAHFVERHVDVGVYVVAAAVLVEGHHSGHAIGADVVQLGVFGKGGFGSGSGRGQCGGAQGGGSAKAEGETGHLGFLC